MKKLFENIYDFFYVITLKKSHKYNIKKSKELIEKIKQISEEENGYAKAIGYLRKIDPFLFEELILTALQNKGHRIKRNRRYTGDGGFDGNVRIDDVWHGIQCKRYKDSINPKHVQEFCNQTEHGLFVHTGRTGDKSREHASNTNIKFVSGSLLIELITGGNTRGKSF